MKNLKDFINESKGSVFKNEVKFSSKDYEAWKKEASKKVEIDELDDLNVIYIDKKHVGTYNKKKQTLATDQIELFGHHVKESINESSYRNLGMTKVSYAGKNKFGFMRYNSNAEAIDVVSFNKLSELADSEGFDVDDYMDIDKLDVGESVSDGAAYIYTRIW